MGRRELVWVGVGGYCSVGWVNLFDEGFAMRFLVVVSAVAAVAMAAAAMIRELQDQPTVLAPRQPR